jgi:phosphoesterase RecJ-like protein
MMEQRFPQHLTAPLKALLATPRRIVITTHSRPDGDAIGSSLGLYNYLLQRDHEVQVITPTDYPVFLKWMAGNDFVLDYENASGKGDEFIDKADLIFCLDFNQLSRVDKKLEQKMRQSAATKILIDHHPKPEDVFQYMFSYPDSCATAELVYQFIVALGDEMLITKQVAECLYTGIMTDTNSFRFDSMSADVHRIVAKLMEAGAVNYKIHEQIYDNNTEDRLRLIGMCLKDKLTLVPEMNSGYIALSKREMEEYHHQPGDTEGLVNYILSIKGVKLAAFFSESLFENNKSGEPLVKLSLRSKDNFYCNEVAEKYFSGGGHKYAAGGKSEVSLEQTVKKFIGILPEYKDKLLA